MIKIDEVLDALERIYEGTGDADSDWHDYDAIRRLIEQAGAVPRRRGSWQDELAVMFSSAPKQEAEPDWLTHVSDQPPADLAPVQIVIYERWLRNERVHKHSTVEDTSWHPGLRYRPVYGPSGLPLVSADRLEPWARFVATDEDGEPLQFSSIPRHDTTTGHWCSAGVFRGVSALAPLTHARPGDWRDSLMEVQR